MTRPDTLATMVGQQDVRDRLRIAWQGAALRGNPAPHTLLTGPAGYGKTTLARIAATELGVPMVASSGATLRRPADACGIACSLEPGSVWFVDEIHRLPAAVLETLYEAIEDGSVSVTVGHGSAARALHIELPPFVFVGATTNPGALPAPFRDRMGLTLQLAGYSDAELAQIVSRVWADVPSDGAAADVVASRCKSVPRIAVHLAERVLDVRAVTGAERITADVAARALRAFGVADDGLDEGDMRVLDTLVNLCGGRPVGLRALSQMVDIDPEALEEVHEPALVRAGWITRTPQGRMATPAAHERMRAL